ncbi:MAG: DUF1467 family protein, partial [Alphaproteobacteria bacterium]|nr:DUF1467 family protein [Alphaproteobacteria bacterium]
NKPDENVVEGNAPSAPAKARIKKKFIITTIISVFLWLAIWGLTQSDLFSFRDWADKW